VYDPDTGRVITPVPISKSGTGFITLTEPSTLSDPAGKTSRVNPM
jgi:hypothetical protein